MVRAFAGLCVAAALALAGCGSSSPVASARSQAAACSNPTPAATMNGTITDNIPTDFDPTANPQPQTTIAFTVLLPPRCPGQTFPLVLHSHGYGGNRITTLAPNGDLHPNDPHFQSIDELVQALPYHGYEVISFDERGHGDSVDANARVIDPNAETQDARAILDWAYDHADQLQLEKQPDSGIPKDLVVGTIGYSYGGGFQMPLAALDPRIDTIVPNGTWNDLLYSLLPGDAVKLSFDGLLCLVAATAKTSATPNTGVHNTPLVQTLCNTVGPQGPAASTIRTRQDLVNAVSQPTAQPRPVTESELDDFFFTHSMAYFQQQQASGQAWGNPPFAGASPPLRKIPALFLQGNRDNLFNMTEAYWNAQYFGASGADVRVITTEGGHMNPLAGQTEGTANCGQVIGVASILAWFDHYLKGANSATFDAIPKLCISVMDTVGAPNNKPVGLELDSFPVGSLSGTGAVPVQMGTLTATVNASDTAPVFVPITTVQGDGEVLAGIPKIAKITVAAGSGATQTAVAYVGVGISRAGSTFLVDDQVTAFVQGDHTSNRGVPQSTSVLLPGVGEQLQKGDQLGLLFYQQNVQYQAVVSGGSATGAGGLSTVPSSAPNPYTVTMTDVELPVLIPGQYPGSRLSQ